MSASGAGAAEARRYTKKDFESDQDVRWCPGCGDYAILSAVQKSMPDLEIPTFRGRGTDPSAWIKPAGEAHAPEPGIVLAIHPGPLIGSGETLIHIGLEPRAV